MSRTPARKRGEDGRLLPLEEAQPDRQDGLDSQEEGDGWEAGEGFNGPADFGTPGQQASLADLQALQAEVQTEQARARKVAEASGVRAE